jgi:hypothetical protein
VARFARERATLDPVVRLTLADGERFFLYAVEPGPGDGFVTLHPHPERYDEMRATRAGERVPPRALAVPLSSIVKVELLSRPPRGTRALVGLHRTPR